MHLGETSVEGKDREQDWTEGIGLRKVSVDLTGFSRWEQTFRVVSTWVRRDRLSLQVR